MAVILFPPRQIAAQLEASEGVEESAGGFTPDDLVQVIDPTMTCTPERFERDLASRGFGTSPAHYADGTCELSFTVELNGHTDNSSSMTTPPKWSKLLQGCGLAEVEVGYVELDGAVGTATIQHAENLVGGTSGEIIPSFGYHYVGDTEVTVLKDATGFQAGEGVTGAYAGGGFSIADPTTDLGAAVWGYGWRPQTEDASNQTLTFHFYIDGERYRVYGARGTAQLRWVTHDRIVADFTFSGIYSTGSTESNLAEVNVNAFEAMEPAAFVNAQATLTDVNGNSLSGADLCFTEATLDLGNNVSMRKCANGTNGWLAGVIANRAPTFQINPDDPSVDTYPFINNLMAGTRARITMRQSAGGTGNRLWLRIPHLQAQSVTPGNRDERFMHDITFDCTRGQDDGNNESVIGNDNEFFLINY